VRCAGFCFLSLQHDCSISSD